MAQERSSRSARPHSRASRTSLTPPHLGSGAGRRPQVSQLDQGAHRVDGRAGAPVQRPRGTVGVQAGRGRRGRRVGPGHQRSGGSPVTVEAHQPVHGGAEADRDDPVTGPAQLRGHVRQAPDGGVAEQAGVELGPPRARHREGVAGARDGPHLAVDRRGHDLGRGGAGVQAEYDVHVEHSAPRPRGRPQVAGRSSTVTASLGSVSATRYDPAPPYEGRGRRAARV